MVRYTDEQYRKELVKLYAAVLQGALAQRNSFEVSPDALAYYCIKVAIHAQSNLDMLADGELEI